MQDSWFITGCMLYAGGMILLAQTSHDMQFKVDTCHSEIIPLDLQFNVSKSVVMHVGPCWNACCAEFVLGSATLKFVDSVKYRGLHLKAGNNFSCTCDHFKLICYSSFNALYLYLRECQVTQNLFLLNYLNQFSNQFCTLA